jgi:hypothetical protein
LLFLLSSQMYSQTSSLPDAPSTQSQPHSQSQAQIPQQTQAPSASPPVAPDPHWLKVEQLPPGKAIVVFERDHDYPASCTMNAAGDTTLVCIQPMPYSPPRRLVFPMHNVDAVYIEEPRSGFSLTPLLVGIGVGGGLGVGICNEGSARVILSCSLVGAAIGAGIAYSPSPRPHPPQIHRRLIYRAAPDNRY